MLVVEDDEAVRTSFVEILRDAGYSVDEAENGYVALEFLKSKRVGAVLLDLGMPVMNGFQLLDLLDDPPPVLLVTARKYDEEVTARMGKVSTFVRKPVHPQYLLDALALILASRGWPSIVNPNDGSGAGDNELKITDEPDATRRYDLGKVRRELELLSHARMSRTLGPIEEARYRELCEIEHRLLKSVG